VRILLVSTTAIGDTIMASPFIRAVRQKHPDAHITMMAHYRRMAVLEHNPHFNHLLPYYGKGKFLIRTLWALRRGRFDLAIVLHANDPDIVPMVRWTGAPQRVGWVESKWSRLFTHTIRRAQPPEHFLLHKKRLLESFGIPVNDLHTEIFFTVEDEVPFHRQIEPWLREVSPSKKYVVMHTFGSNPKKWWSLDHFFQVAQHIHERDGWPTVFVGEHESLEMIAGHPRFGPKKHFVARNCSVRQSAFIIKKASRMLTTDSGPMHLAFAVKCPTLSLFGPTNPAIHGPCFDRNLHQVIHRNPLASLTADEVIQAWDASV